MVDVRYVILVVAALAAGLIVWRWPASAVPVTIATGIAGLLFMILFS